MAGAVAQWFREIVLPIWKKHTIEMRPSPEQLERDLLLKQGFPQTRQCQSENTVLDLFEMTNSGAALSNEEYRLFTVVKIEYSAYNVPEGHADFGVTATDVNKAISDEYPAENPQPFFVGTSRMRKLCKHLSLASKALPVGACLRHREVNLRRKWLGLKKQRALTSLRQTCFRNPYQNKSVGGYVFSDGYSCLCLHFASRLVIMEEYLEGSPNSQARGGLVFFFINPLFADKALLLLDSMLHERKGNWVSARQHMERLVKLLTIFLFPCLTISIPELSFDVESADEVGEYCKIFFDECKILWVNDSMHEILGVDVYLFTFAASAQSFYLKVRLRKYFQDTEGVFCVNYMKVLGHVKKDIKLTIDGHNGGDDTSHKIAHWYWQAMGF